LKKKIDNLGRVVIPKPMLKELGITDDVNIEVRNKQIIITNTKQMRTKEEIRELMKTLTDNDDTTNGIKWALEWVMKEDLK